MGPPLSRPSLPYERLTTARAWRIVVYALAAVLILLLAGFAVQLAQPPDRHASIRVETLPGLSNAEDSRIERVRWDAQTGRTAIDVWQPDGTLRRYYVTEGERGIELSGGEEASPESP
ncbi:MAG: hypothetical protein U9R79_07830 [Armatimonadota bacterium]|nr:hypothetical protein [Armatimonadota bacterium]